MVGIKKIAKENSSSRIVAAEKTANKVIKGSR